MAILRRLKTFMEAVANVISTAILILFYFTVFALFAIPLKLGKNFLKSKGNDTGYTAVQKQYDTINSLLNE